MTYSEKLTDPRWQKRRLEIMQRDDFACQEGDSKEKTLNVHHLYYVSGRDPWNYPSVALVTLCRECHKIQTDLGEGEIQPWEWLLDMLANGNQDGLEMLHQEVDDFRLRGIESVHATAVRAFMWSHGPYKDRDND
jgi:hypothetical protein